MDQYLTFRLKDELFGLPISLVREINRVAEVTPIPKAPHFVKGVMNLRGKIVPIVDLRVKFDMDETPYTRDTCIIVIETPFGLLGNIVDAVREVLEFPQSDIEPAPHFGSQELTKFITGLAKKEDKVYILVNITHLFGTEDWHSLSQVGAQAA